MENSQVRILPTRLTASIAQLEERLLAMQKAVGSNPITRSICRFRAYIGNGCEIVSLVLLDEYVITRDKDTKSARYGGSIPPMTQINVGVAEWSKAMVCKTIQSSVQIRPPTLHGVYRLEVEVARLWFWYG